jgi:hypothetical protein
LALFLMLAPFLPLPVTLLTAMSSIRVSPAPKRFFKVLLGLRVFSQTDLWELHESNNFTSYFCLV